MHTASLWVPRPAAMKDFDFTQLPGSTGPYAGEAIIEIGDKVYGWVASGRNPGRSEPFCYDFSKKAFITLIGITEFTTPISTSSRGEWTPPTISKVGGWVLFTHPGFKLPNAIGWIDVTALDDTATGDVGYRSIDGGVWDTDLWDRFDWAEDAEPGGQAVINLSKDVFEAGWRPGQLITDSEGAIAPGTTIREVARDGLAILLSQRTLTDGPVIGDTLRVLGGTKEKPLWAAGNININPLINIANAVQIFNGRAWYAVENATVFSDAEDPLVASNANQVLTLQNGLDITAESTIPFNNKTSVGGIVNALLLWQGDSGIWQVTGDSATDDLALNFLSPLGTLAPNTIASCPLGTFFVAPDGIRLIQLDGTVSDPISANGDGVALPFVNATFPSRMCAAFNEDVLRITATGEDTIGGSTIPDMVSREYWYHMKLKAWSGPHSFPAKLITPSNRPHTNHGFLMFPLGGRGGSSGLLATGGGGVLAAGRGSALAATEATRDRDLPEVWFSNTRPLINSVYTENGEQMRWRYATTLLPDNLVMFQNMCIESTVMLALTPPGSYVLDADSLWDVMSWNIDVWDGPTPTIIPVPGQTARVRAFNEAGQLLAETQINGFRPFPDGTQLSTAPPSFWDTMVWNRSLWDADVGGAIPAQRRIAWPRPLVYKQMIVEVTSESSPRVAIGNLYLRHQQLGYQIADYATVAALGRPGAPPLNGVTR